MEKTIQPGFGGNFGSASRMEKNAVGFFGLLGQFVERYLYPEIRSNDYRIAEYIPPVVGAGRN